MKLSSGDHSTSSVSDGK